MERAILTACCRMICTYFQIYHDIKCTEQQVTLQRWFRPSRDWIEYDFVAVIQFPDEEDFSETQFCGVVRVGYYRKPTTRDPGFLYLDFRVENVRNGDVEGYVPDRERNSTLSLVWKALGFGGLFGRFDNAILLLAPEAKR